MIDRESAADARKAEQARARLIQDIRDIKKLGDDMVDKTESAIKSGPVILGFGAAGAIVLGVIVYASRSRSGRIRIFRQRSFVAETLRNAALSALGIVAGRVAQRLLVAALPEAIVTPADPEAANPPLVAEVPARP